jgi:DNA-binding response OmpR family regulator
MVSAAELSWSSDEPRGLDLVLAAADEETHRSLGPLLWLGGFAVRPARSHAEARRAVEESLPDVLIAATDLPGGSGHVLVGALRELPGGGHPAVVMLGCRHGRCDPAPAVEAGADVVLDHSLEWGVLARVLAQVLALRHLERLVVL